MENTVGDMKFTIFFSILQSFYSLNFDLELFVII